MISKLYGRLFVIAGGTFALLWFSFGYLNDGQYIPRFRKHPEVIDDDYIPSARHWYKRSGLLEVNPGGPHPIFELMERGEALWKGKLARQSKTLSQAVKEYRRRYARDPPIGFDKWWEYVEKHNVQLRDEYDQILKSLDPFWGISPQKLEKLRIQELERDDLDLFTIKKELGKNLTVTGHSKFRWAIDNQLNMLWEIQDLLPPLNATYSPHDNPMQFVSHEWRKATALAALTKSVLPDDFIAEEGDVRGWAAACSPNTVYRPSRPPVTSHDPPPKTFIFDHKTARDACSYPAPSFFPIAGLYALHKEPGPDPLLEASPIFSTCGTTLHADIIAPTLYLWIEDVWESDPPFSKKKDDHLYWRGSNTGSYFSNDDQHLLTQSHRTRLVHLTSQNPPVENTTISVLSPHTGPHEPVGYGSEHNLVEVNKAMMNVSFAGKPLQCDEEICEKLTKMYDFGPFIDDHFSQEFKYVIDVDGNGWSGRFKRMMTNHALIFKSTVYLEWLTDRIAPWVHYVPIQLDYSDLYDSLFFFHGDENGMGGHPELAEKIANAGREWSFKFWRKEDMTAYIFRLYLEYARVMSPERTKQNFRL